MTSHWWAQKTLIGITQTNFTALPWWRRLLSFNIVMGDESEVCDDNLQEKQQSAGLLCRWKNSKASYLWKNLFFGLCFGVLTESMFSRTRGMDNPFQYIQTLKHLQRSVSHVRGSLTPIFCNMTMLVYTPQCAQLKRICKTLSLIW